MALMKSLPACMADSQLRLKVQPSMSSSGEENFNEVSAVLIDNREEE